MASPFLNESLLEQFKQIVGETHFTQDADLLAQYGKDWTHQYKAHPSVILFPQTTEQVQAIIQLANEYKISLVPSGGRTGLSGGAVASEQEVVVSLARMNMILSFDPYDRQMRCQAGVITAQIHEFAKSNNLMYPVDFASSGSSQIGGNLATNAGGIKVLRYGMTREWVMGLTVVTGKGEVLRLGNGLVKNNAGYDLKQLFIGAEGTLGIITEVTLKLTDLPPELSVIVVGVADIPSVMKLLQRFRQGLTLTAFEYFSTAALEKVVQHKKLPRPFETLTPHYVLIEFENQQSDDEADAINIVEQSIADGIILDGVISKNNAQAKNLWRLREDISETLSVYTPYKNDIAVRISQVPDFIAAVEKIIGCQYPDYEIVWFGHIGDGNLHLNVLKPPSVESDEFYRHCEEVSRTVFEVVRQFHGSISAEHGVGLLKKAPLAVVKDAAEIDIMRAIKKSLDPNGIMNPGKIFELNKAI